MDRLVRARRPRRPWTQYLQAVSRPPHRGETSSDH
jgi:hypothetical protein